MSSQIFGMQGVEGVVEYGGGVGGVGVLHCVTFQSCAMFSHDLSICPSGRVQSFARLLSQTPEKCNFNYTGYKSGYIEMK